MISAMTATAAPPRCTNCGAEQDDRIVYDVSDVERVLDISRSSVYALLRTGQLLSYRVLGSRKVDRRAVHDFLRNATDTPVTAPQS